MKHLNQIHLSRLSPVMWPVRGPYPNAPWWEPIHSSEAMVGMGSNYEPAQPDIIHPRADALWSNLYRITPAGALNRVAPFGPSAFGNDLGPAEEGAASPSLAQRLGDMWPLILAFGGAAAMMLLIGRR
jgi:hypothetical protein